MMYSSGYIQDYIYYIFQDGYIPVSKTKKVYFEQYKPSSDRVHLEGCWVYIKTDGNTEGQSVHHTGLFMLDPLYTTKK
jgi:hypothetical protein